MKKKDLLELTESLRKDFTKDTTEIIGALNALNTALDDSVKSILTKMQEKIAKKQFDIEEYTKSVARVEDLKADTDNFLFFLTCTDDEKNDWKIKNTPNLSNCSVDNTIEHTLNESFNFTAPYGFSIKGGDIIKIENWKQLFFRVCEYFILIDEKIFLSFENKKYMNGRKTKYFSTNPDALKNPISINNKIYIKSLKDIDIIKKIIVNMLDEYNFDLEDLLIYLTSDYTELNI